MIHRFMKNRFTSEKGESWNFDSRVDSVPTQGAWVALKRGEKVTDHEKHVVYSYNGKTLTVTGID